MWVNNKKKCTDRNVDWNVIFHTYKNFVSAGAVDVLVEFDVMKALENYLSNLWFFVHCKVPIADIKI